MTESAFQATILRMAYAAHAIVTPTFYTTPLLPPQSPHLDNHRSTLRRICLAFAVPAPTSSRIATSYQTLPDPKHAFRWFCAAALLRTYTHIMTARTALLHGGGMPEEKRSSGPSLPRGPFHRPTGHPRSHLWIAGKTTVETRANRRRIRSSMSRYRYA